MARFTGWPRCGEGSGSQGGLGVRKKVRRVASVWRGFTGWPGCAQESPLSALYTGPTASAPESLDSAPKIDPLSENDLQDFLYLFCFCFVLFSIF